MTEHAERGSVHWGRWMLGVVLLIPSAWALAVVLAILARGSAFAFGVLALLPTVCALLWMFAMGVQCVAHGLRKTEPPPCLDLHSGLLAVILAGLFFAPLYTMPMLGPDWPPDRAAHLVGGAALLGAATAMFVLVGVLWRSGARRPLTPGWDGTRSFCVVALPFLLAIAFVTLTTVRHPLHRDFRPAERINHARAMAILLSERSYRKRWPPHGGKNFVLSLVAYGLIDPRNPDNLVIFFRDGRRGEGEAPTSEAYARVTKDALRTRRFPELTDFAGRRNDEPRYRLQENVRDADEPILACVYEDRALVGFANGRVRLMDREDLGLEPDDPLVFGDASGSPLLRKLSEE